ncbi:CotH kinase family protein [Acholeplasma equirhinis]|uniref:CotH kinase family protein n=1 Tax=Acholeplasma equirhinis TaxID=555393 RepID=UPI00197A8F8B|nr:CotH kinase family protein [Acholeplasma equirhinis]MBN3490163.1 CotH kinase family protein [Acholeplasma equirhinis]
MKKIWLLILSLSMILATFSCKINPINTNPKDDDPIVEEPNQPEEPSDLFGFNRLFNDDIYKTLTIKITRSEWQRFRQLQLQNQQQYGTIKLDTYVKADLLYEDHDGSLLIKNIGFRNRGNTSIDFISDSSGNPIINHFKFNFRYQFDGEHPENQGRRGFELKELDLKYNKNQVPHYMTEAYSLEMFEHFGVYAQEVSHALIKLDIDGEKHTYGLYTIFEPIDDEFIERRFSKESSKGDLYKSLWQGYGPASLQIPNNQAAYGEETLTYHPAYDLKSNKDIYPKHNNLSSFINGINAYTGEDFIHFIDQNFNVEMFLRYLAVNVFLGNPDDYRAMGNNYYLYQDSKTKKWYMFPYDFDHALGNGWNPINNYTIGIDIYDWFNQMVINSNNNFYKPILAQKILDIPQYRALYEEILTEILNDQYFTFEYFYQRYQKTKLLYQNTFSNAILNLGFSRGNSEWYINAKIQDVQNQLM